MDTTPSLDTATMEEIVDELGRRHPGALIVWLEDHKTNPELEKANAEWRGGTTLARGLAAYAASYIDMMMTSELHTEEE